MNHVIDGQSESTSGSLVVELVKSNDPAATVSVGVNITEHSRR